MGTLGAILNAIATGGREIKKLIRRGLQANQIFNNPSLLLQIFLKKLTALAIGFFKGTIAYIVLAMLVIGVMLEGSSLFVTAFKDKTGKDLGSNFNGDIVEWANNLTDKEVKELIENGSPFNPKNIPLYIGIEEKTIPANIATVQKRHTSIYTKDKGIKTDDDELSYNLNLSKTAYPYRLPWQFLVALDVINETGHKTSKKSKELVRNAEIELAPTYTWGYNKYAKDVTDSEQIWVYKYKNGKLVSKELIKETHVTNSYPLPYLDAVSTMLKDYTFRYKLDQVTRNDPWSEKIEVGRKEWKKKKKTGEDEEGNPKYKTIRYKEITYKKNKKKIVEDLLVEVDEQLNPDRLYSFFDSNKISLQDLEFMYQIIARLPKSSDIASLIEEVLEMENGEFTGSYGDIGFDSTVPHVEGDWSRADLINTAKSLLDLPYFWGGKHSGLGRHPDWGKPKIVTAKGSWATGGPAIPYGLDCSGYTSWVYNQMLIPMGAKKLITGTVNQWSATYAIKESELRPGDLGFYQRGGGIHVGIYIGEINGYKAFIHDGGKTWKAKGLPAGRVVISYNKTSKYYKGNAPTKFKYFRRVKVKFSDDEKLSVPNVLPSELKYKDINIDKMIAYLEKRKSYFADEKSVETFIKVGRKYDVNPYLLIAITGQEQGFVKRTHPYAEQIANNPFNVFGSWKKAQPGLEKSAEYAAKTIIKLSDNRPDNYHPIKWLCGHRNPLGYYAEDPDWWVGVTKILRMFEKF